VENRKRRKYHPIETKILTLMYKWEFLRRNKEYRSDYFVITKEYHIYDLLKALRNRRRSDVDNWSKANTLLSKWGIRNPLNPHFSYIDFWKMSSEKIRWFQWSLKGDHFDALLSWSNLANLSDIEILTKVSDVEFRVDLFAPKEYILYEFEKAIDKLKMRIKTALMNLYSEKGKAYSLSFRKKLANYKRYLEVYDLRCKKWSWDKLANKFYKNDGGGINYARLKVKRDFKRCQRFIESGYKQLR